MRRLRWYASLVVLTYAVVVYWHLVILARLGSALRPDQVHFFGSSLSFHFGRGARTRTHDPGMAVSVADCCHRRASVEKEMAKPRMAKSVREEEVNRVAGRMAPVKRGKAKL